MADKPGTPIVLQPGAVSARARAEAAAHFKRAVEQHQAGRYAEAELLYRQALDLDPNHAEAIHHLGVIAFRAGHPAEAVEIIRDALALEPRNAAAHSNLGMALQAVERDEQALASYDRALALKPAYPEAHYNRGNVLRDLGRYEEALASYDKAIVHRPKYVEAHVNRGRTLVDLGRLKEAVFAYDRALHLQPGFAAAELNRAVALLAQGDFARGLPQYEARWREAQLAGARRSFAAPMWDGREPLAGRSILLHAEQGLGDTIQFGRYVPLLARQGARVVLEAQAPLVPLLQTLEGVAAVIARGEALPDTDFHCPLLSLPLVCSTRLDTIPAGVPYLRADPQRVADWERRLGARRHAPGGLRIGLAFSGNPAYVNDRTRSVPLARLVALFSPEREFVSLQKEMHAADVELLRSRADRIRAFADELADFADTAALVAGMDLVISVDTASAHLAGALGKPLWLLLPFAPDWRWLRDRPDTPWYPGARLFRQPRPGDWDAVVAEVALALRAQAGASAGA